MTEPDTTVRMGGGWSDTRASRMSPTLARRMAEDEAAEARAEREVRRMREEVAEIRRDDAVRASIELALQRGEEVDLLQAVRDGGVGHTPAEFVALCHDQQDIEDRRSATRQRKAFEKWQLEQAAAWQGDASAPRPGEVVEREQASARAAELKAFSDRQTERAADVEKARQQAVRDRRYAVGQ